MLISASGYEDAHAKVPANRQVAASLQPRMIKAVYANLGVLATPERLEELIHIADTTEINAMVVDVKQDTIYYDTQVPFFKELDGVVEPVFDPKQLLDELHQHNIYVIARMVVFKDPIVAEQRPDLAVKDAVKGGLWRDDNGAAWVNAFDEELWRANADLGAELTKLGFDEVQYDYIRFPSDGNLKTSEFGRDYTEATRRAAIAGAVKTGADAIHAAGGKFSLDLFPIIALEGNDQGIGQTLQDLTPIADYISLMIYPSHFITGNIPVDGMPNDFPTETVDYTLK
ncbi:MAG TPA: putative glycoside hydrolase, partial [Thermomicrobiales bacterium]|nr:putative glycoside hydrolase [Thermomicrobiales bacterium]